MSGQQHKQPILKLPEKPQEKAVSDLHLQEIRLELVKLVFSHGKDAPTIVDKAAELETYVVEGRDK
jgi:hypothetical protein